MSDIKRFLDEKGRVKTWPSKKMLKIEILRHIADYFEYGRFYSEREVNTIIENCHTFNDYFLVRRGLIDNSFLTRTKNGSMYWKEETVKYKIIYELISSSYNIGNIKSILRLSYGFGSHSYYILSEKGEFIFKDIEQNQMNHPENEAFILNELELNNIPVSKIIPTKSGDFLLKEHNKICHLQTYVNGKIYSRNSAPEWLLKESAQMLGKIHKSLEALPTLPIGISQGFIDNRTPQNVKVDYEMTLKLAYENGDSNIIDAINSKKRMLDEFEGFSFDFNKMTCKNTHGDYKIQQIICDKDKINAVIDFTSACVHPVCWEIIRSYALADSECVDGSLNIDNLKKYLSYYLEYCSLNSYDLKIMPYIYYYQNLISDYYRQYYNSANDNKNILLDDASFYLKQCKWFENNIVKLETEIQKGF